MSAKVVGNDVSAQFPSVRDLYFAISRKIMDRLRENKNLAAFNTAKANELGALSNRRKEALSNLTGRLASYGELQPGLLAGAESALSADFAGQASGIAGQYDLNALQFGEQSELNTIGAGTNLYSTQINAPKKKKGGVLGFLTDIISGGAKAYAEGAGAGMGAKA